MKLQQFIFNYLNILILTGVIGWGCSSNDMNEKMASKQNYLLKDTSLTDLQDSSIDNQRNNITENIQFIIADSCFILESNGALPNLQWTTSKNWKSLINESFPVEKKSYIIDELPKVNCDLEGFYNKQGIFLKTDFKLTSLEVLNYIELPEQFTILKDKTFIYTYSTNKNLGVVWESNENGLHLIMIVHMAPCEG